MRTQFVHLYKDDMNSELWHSIMRRLKCEVEDINGFHRNPICDTDLIGLELKVIAHEHFENEK